MMRRVLAIQNDIDEDLGLLAEPLLRAGAEATTVRAFAGEPVPRALDAHDGLIVLGGAPSAHDLSTGPWMADAMRLIRAAHEAEKPVLGICLGAQLAAQALGGRALPGAGPEVGFEPIELLPDARGDPVVGRLEGAPLVSWHDHTYLPPPGAVRLARSRRYAEQAFRLGRRTYALQFHVDLSPGQLAATMPALADEARRREAGMRAAAEAVVRGWTGI
jgi:GMP synthase (glutamine-hydrolysing)